MHFTGSIVEGGGILNYYEYVREMVDSTSVNGSGCYATYDFMMYMILGIWGIPLWIFCGSKGIPLSSSFAAMVYGKSIYIVALFFASYLVYTLCQDLDMDKTSSEWASILFASSIFVLTAIGINGQTDILGIPFILLGIKAYVNRNWRNFLFWFMVAACFKMYALFIFLPLLLLYEKNIIKIGINGICVLLLKVGMSLPFDSNSLSMQSKKDFEKEIIDRLTYNKLPLLHIYVPTVYVLLFALCAFCYLHKEITEKDMHQKYSIFVPMASMILLFISFESSSYWFLHMCPYLAIMLVYNSKNQKNNFLLEVGGLLSITLAYYGNRSWAYEIYHCRGMLLEKLFGLYDSITAPLLLEDFCIKVHITKLVGALNAAYVVAMLAFLWVNRPEVIEHENNFTIKPWFYFRLALTVCVGWLPVLLAAYNLIFLK